MFIICFGDGLGNQMFQYAFYKSICRNYPDSKVKMDIFHIYGSCKHNGFELDRIFGIDKNECCKTDALILSDYFGDYTHKYILLNLFFRIRRLIFGRKDSYILQEEPTVYYKEIYQLNILKSYIFRGNWINPKYFEDLREELLQEFSFPPLKSEKNKYYASQITESESVSIHVRRGDYLNYKFYYLDKDYYKRATDIIKSKVAKAKFFIFTDDKENIKDQFCFLEDFIIVEGNEGSMSYVDMQLMSICKHNILANSTFSFWAGYLNKNDDKIVIAPNKVASDIKNPFACQEWILIDVEKNENN